MSVCHSVHGGGGSLYLALPPSTSTSTHTGLRPCPACPPPRTRSNLFIMMHRLLESGQLAYNRNAFLLPPATKLGQGYIFTAVCESVHRGGDLPQCMLGYHIPQEQTSPHPPRADTPPPPGSRHPPDQAPTCPDQARPTREQTPTPPPVQSMLGDTVNARAVRILLECNLVCRCFFCIVNFSTR